MEFLRELYSLVTPSKSNGKAKGIGGIVPVNSFVAGRQDDDDNKKDGKTSDVGTGGMDGGCVGESSKVVVPVAKPRNKQLHDTLSGRKGGRMADKKSDYKRKDKHPKRGFFEAQTPEE